MNIVGVIINGFLIGFIFIWVFFFDLLFKFWIVLGFEVFFIYVFFMIVLLFEEIFNCLCDVGKVKKKGCI